MVNVLVSSYGGLNLPRTLCVAVPREFPVDELCNGLHDLLPTDAASCARFSTGSIANLRALPQKCNVGSLLEDVSVNLLSLRLSAPLRGGKGGFGSQLRAAGGRMSSRKRKQNAEQATGSARNLDGRRLRTIAEAKNLAAYLATKPDMDRKEKDEKRKRWEMVIELADQREADMKAGKTADGRRKGLSSEWIEEQEEIHETVKNAVKLAMSRSDAGVQSSSKGCAESSPSSSADEDSDTEDVMVLDEQDMSRLRLEAENGDADALWVLRERLKIPDDVLPRPKTQSRRLVGFDDDLSSTSDEEDATDRV